MRVVDVDAGTDLAALERALFGGPAEVRLEAAPERIGRLDLLLAISRANGPLLARFSRDLATPLAEIALLSPFARFSDGLFLDVRGALLTPLVLRHGATAARRLLARFGARLPAGEALGPPSSSSRLSSRSPLALRLARELLAPPRRAAMARERAAFGLVMAAGDRAEGIRAFREKRAPAFDWGES